LVADSHLAPEAQAFNLNWMAVAAFGLQSSLFDVNRDAYSMGASSAPAHSE